jgi:hypothetical protein
VEAPVPGVLVLTATVDAHRKAGHRRVRTVVRNLADDREPRTALRAVDERIPVPAIVGVEELTEAVLARGDVGRDERALPRRLARGDRELGLAAQRQRLHRDRVDAGQARRLVPNGLRKHVEHRRRSFRLDHHAVAVVEDEADEAVSSREAVHERPEPDALHDAAHPKPPPLEQIQLAGQDATFLRRDTPRRHDPLPAGKGGAS